MVDSRRSGALQGIADEAARLGEEVRQLQDVASALAANLSRDEQSLHQRALALEEQLRRLHSDLDFSAMVGSIDPRTAEKVDDELQKAQYLLSEGDAAFLLPPKSSAGWLLGMFLGKVRSVRANRKDVQLKVKEEYNKFRDSTAIFFLVFPSTLLFLRSWIWEGCFPTWPVQLYQACLLFLYTNLALRENILRVNGSRIGACSAGDSSQFRNLHKWIYHHYCAMLMALVSLTWDTKGQPDCAYKQRGLEMFLAWAIMHGVAMLLQNRYQRKRLYTRIALGKAKRMNVVWGGAAGVHGQLLLLLYPILFTLQMFEAYVGVSLLCFASGMAGMVCGFLLVVMALGNFVNTVHTMVAKSKVKPKGA